MRRFIFYLCLSLLAFIYTGCGNSNRDIIKLVEERDSLKSFADSTKQRLATMDELVSTVATINSSLDYITAQENIIFIEGPSETKKLDKDAIKVKLDTLKYTLETQRQRIEQLEQELAKKSTDNNLQSLVSMLKKQLALKDSQIKQLEEELTKKDADIKRLNQIITENKDVISNFSNALNYQDSLLNNCYVLISSKKDLKAKGILKGNKLNSDAFNRSRFMKVDIREFREVTFEAKKPKVLTNMSSSSYILGTNDRKNFTLKITNPTAFWEVSNFLVIQTD